MSKPARGGQEPVDRLDRDDEQEADPDRDGHADPDIGGGDRSPIDEPAHRAVDRAARPRIAGAAAELALDPEQPVVLGHPLGARRCPGLDLAGAHRHDEVGDRRVLGLAGTMADDRGPAGPPGEVDRLDRLGQGADLVELDQDGSSSPARRSPRAMNRGFVTRMSSPTSWTFEPKSGGQLAPAGPVILGQAVLERDDRILRRSSAPTGRSARPNRAFGPRGARWYWPGTSLDAGPLDEDRAGGRVEGDRRPRRRAGSRPSRSPGGSASTASSFEGRDGAKPPSSP